MIIIKKKYIYLLFSCRDFFYLGGRGIFERLRRFFWKLYDLFMRANQMVFFKKINEKNYVKKNIYITRAITDH